ncbi:histidine phosphatase family protein [Pseudaminobacter sp. 19-2017]|uniref:Histidine phosphatase family protein n=1 Tax=Pseudaminobacter soli (ex Zhang et al. 2022) TaxID=2831468 RepID=A0A942DVF9_9HYPH|nr:histidine phosphatase family protein [Pseudaminobacter soli]MBS3647431.1 histidine phosphatase family protein [Pseudaminobacter soli]
MKTLLLLRHAKSSRNDPSLGDFDRPLAPRGVRAASRMGREIARLAWIPDLALVSPARRTAQTWELLTLAVPRQSKVESPRALYEAPAESLLAELRQIPDEVESVLLLGHNPGLQDAALRLAGPQSTQSLVSRMKEKFPTAALARFALEGPWSGLQPESARLTDFIRPRDLD